MTINKNELQAIADVLPIGYYAKARVSVEVDENAETSYFMPTNRKIFVSLQGVNASLSGVQVSTPEEAEKAVRAHLYHELSHAILTPKALTISEFINVFEDERIETLLNGFYHNVNFKENVKALNNFDPTYIPRTPMEKFFYACRYRIGKDEWIDEVADLIEKYRDMNWNDKEKHWQYYHDVCDLFNKITKDYSVIEQDWQKMIADALAKEQAQIANADVPDEYAEGVNGDSENAQGGGNGTANEGEEENNEAGKEKQSGASDDKGQKTKNGGEGDEYDFISDVFANVRDENLFQALDDILQNYSKKNKGGSSMQSYSGVFNPRNCARDDFRYFDRQSGVRGSNPFGSLHLNLFIDDSGSFDENADAANKIIATMIDLSKKYSFFNVDFCLCGSKVKRVDHNHAYVTANSGTHVQGETMSIVKKMQIANTFNYNIVLYDGWASFRSNELKHEFEPWDMSNTTFILDPSCKNTGNANRIKNGKVIISRDYTRELSKHILDTLSKAFR